MHYILSSLFVALLWSFGIIVDSHICRKHFMGGFFIRLACFGIALPFIYLLMKAIYCLFFKYHSKTLVLLY